MCGICRNDYDKNSINFIDCCRNVKKIPKDLINLKILYCFDAQVKKIPKTLINLKTLRIHNTQIKFIPDTLINLVILGCCNNILISPQTIKIEPNNKYYLTFTRYQKKI
jgi:Leucine-rich repeat (LRR) protein